MRKYDYIDNLRGWAILGVIFVHTAQSVTSLHPVLGTISNYGKHGVQLFFVMSAYTLCLSRYGRAGEKNANSRYFVRRFFRIAPLYYFGILLYGLVHFLKSAGYISSFSVTTEYSTGQVLSHLTFTQSIFPSTIFAVVPGGWSIGTEMLFYLFFPFLFDFLIRIRRKYMLILIPIAAALGGFVFFRGLPHLFPPLDRHDFSYYYCTILNQLPVFLVGICTFALLRDKIIGPKGAWLSLVIFFGLTALLLYVKYLGFIDITLFPFGTAVTFVFLFMACRSLPILNIPVIRWIGKVSFSVYLFHFLFAWGFSRYLSRELESYMSSNLVFPINLALTITGSLIMASLTKFLIEDKGISLGNRLIRKKLS